MPPLLRSWMLVALVVSAGCGLLGASVVGRLWRRVTLRRRFARGRRAEREAAELLAAAGYRVVGEQVEGRYELRVAGEPRPICVRADLLVERCGRCYLVEVKTGRASDPCVCADTRRQLLEYCHAYPEVDGLLLADMQQRRIRAIDFGGRTPTSGRWLRALLLLLLGAGAGAAAVLAAASSTGG